tara:strand:- start:15 stop:506 length:492 start_codon:yes stop_codon:yes gene_type:complete
MDSANAGSVEMVGRRFGYGGFVFEVTMDADLSRFVRAQEGRVSGILQELGEGKKQTHWMWFVFPQIQGLGRSSIAQRFAIVSLTEARGFLNHEILGPRLRECTAAVLRHPNLSAEEIFGFPDWLKFRSSMTLFAEVSEPESVFHQALNMFFDGTPDVETLSRM